jgi:hypothetical protein
MSVQRELLSDWAEASEKSAHLAFAPADPRYEKHDIRHRAHGGGKAIFHFSSRDLTRPSQQHDSAFAATEATYGFL